MDFCCRFTTQHKIKFLTFLSKEMHQTTSFSTPTLHQAVKRNAQMHVALTLCTTIIRMAGNPPKH